MSDDNDGLTKVHVDLPNHFRKRKDCLRTRRAKPGLKGHLTIGLPKNEE